MKSFKTKLNFEVNLPKKLDVINKKFANIKRIINKINFTINKDRCIVPDNPNPPPVPPKKNIDSDIDFLKPCVECKESECSFSTFPEKDNNLGNFLCFLIDKFEGNTITEELLQLSLAKFLKSEFYDMVTIIKGQSVGPTEVIIPLVVKNKPNNMLSNIKKGTIKTKIEENNINFYICKHFFIVPFKNDKCTYYKNYHGMCMKDGCPFPSEVREEK